MQTKSENGQLLLTAGGPLPFAVESKFCHRACPLDVAGCTQQQQHSSTVHSNDTSNLSKHEGMHMLWFAFVFCICAKHLSIVISSNLCLKQTLNICSSSNVIVDSICDGCLQNNLKRLKVKDSKSNVDQIKIQPKEMELFGWKTKLRQADAKTYNFRPAGTPD